VTRRDVGYALGLSAIIVSALAFGWPRVALPSSEPVTGWGQTAYAGHGPEYWHWRYVVERRQAADDRRELRQHYRPSVIRALQLAAIAYRVDAGTLIRKADCETGGTFSPFALNHRSGAAGVMQFLASTWHSTPYARFSRFDPYANALAAAYMHSPAVGRGGEWSCR
jgi:hypothetical protein